MRKLRDQEKSTAFSGRPKLEEIAIEPVDDLMARMQEVNEDTLEKLKAAEQASEMQNGCRCPCNYCIAKRCDLHDLHALGRTFSSEGGRRDLYRPPDLQQTEYNRGGRR